jgi:hypothetical protein
VLHATCISKHIRRPVAWQFCETQPEPAVGPHIVRIGLTSFRWESATRLLHGLNAIELTNERAFLVIGLKPAWLSNLAFPGTGVGQYPMTISAYKALYHRKVKDLRSASAVAR